jgi:hypothetical protein
MRIEYQGQVQARTYYMHVGYISAAMSEDPRYAPQSTPTAAGAMGLAVLVLLASVMVARRAKSLWGRGLAVALFAAAVCTGVQAVRLTLHPVVTVKQRVATTLYRLEELSAVADGWLAVHGRPPSPIEWHDLTAGPEANDGFGQPFRYELFDPDKCEFPLIEDINNQAGYKLVKWSGYVIYSKGGRGSRSELEFTDINNWYLGLDGVWGTADEGSAG